MRKMQELDMMTDCEIWTGATQPNGYGRRKINGKAVLAHRHAYEIEYGPIPSDLVIDHLCFQRACVNPRHLQLLTREDNARRHPANCSCPKHNPERYRLDECKHGHKLNVIGGRTAHKRCRVCVNNRNREYMRKQRASEVSTLP